MVEPIWKQFRNYNYEVSPQGDIRNTITGRVLKQRQQKEGYLLIDIRINNESKTFRSHRIIAEVYHGAREHGWEVDHINKKRNDNRADNLRWLNKSSNSANRIYCGVSKSQIASIINFYSTGDTIEKIYLKINNKIN